MQVKIPSSISWKSKAICNSLSSTKYVSYSCVHGICFSMHACIYFFRMKGSCGSCYSFSAIGALESAYGIKHDKKESAIPRPFRATSEWMCSSKSMQLPASMS